MSKKRQTRNSKKFKKAAASQRARAPMQRGGRMFAGNTPNFDERTGTVKRAPTKQAPITKRTAGIKPPRPPGKTDPSEGTSRPDPTPTGVSARPDNTTGALPEFTGTVPNLTETGRVFQPTTTTRAPVGDDAGQLPPSDDGPVVTDPNTGTGRGPANAAEARARQRAAQEIPNPSDYRQGVNDPAYRDDIEEYYIDNPIDINLGGGVLGNNNLGGTNSASSDLSQAPIDLEINLPDRPDLPQVTPEDVPYGPDSVVYQMGDTGDAKATSARATTARAQADAEAAQAAAPQQVQAAQMEAAIAEGVAPGVAARGQVSDEAIARVEEGTITQPAIAATRDSAQEAASRAVAAQRPEEREYAQGITTDERFTVIEAEDPEVATRIAQTISSRAKKDLMDIVTGEGVDLDDLPEFKLAEKRTAQVAEAQQGIAQELGNVPSADLQGRQAITGEAPKGDAAQIGGIPTMAAAQRQAITGQERRTAAADMNAVVGNLPPKITEAILEDPQTVEAQLDTAPVAVKAAIAALPKEALVSTQMEGLLAGMEEGKTPLWAKPAVDAINAQMASRGLSTSTVGRDALFNAIIQSALPMAQSNAQALQQRASQNLSNKQQANLQQASQVMQQRMANLSNRQTAASQTAQMAQEINVRQAEFEQQAVLTTAQQEQQTRTQNLQNAQQRAAQESAQRQQTALANLDAGSRIDLANLDALNQAGAQNLTAEQQTRLSEYNAKVNRVMRQADLEQDMEKANLSADLQIELKNLTEQNAAARDTMTAQNQERLTNLSVLVDFKKTNASLAQQMDLANMNSAQQIELANLAERAATDSANFTEANRFRLRADYGG